MHLKIEIAYIIVLYIQKETQKWLRVYFLNSSLEVRTYIIGLNIHDAWYLLKLLGHCVQIKLNINAFEKHEMVIIRRSLYKYIDLCAFKHLL